MPEVPEGSEAAAALEVWSLHELLHLLEEALTSGPH
jgi:hypothetical protein